MTVKQKATKWLAHFALVLTLVMSTVTTGSAEAVGGAGAKAVKKGAKILSKGAKKGARGNQAGQIRKGAKGAKRAKGAGRKSSVLNKADKLDVEEKKKKKIRRLVFKGWVIVAFADGQKLCPPNMEEAHCLVLTPDEECLVLQARDQKRKREGRGRKTRPPAKCRQYMGEKNTPPITITSPTITVRRDKLRSPRHEDTTATVISPVRE